MLELSGESYIIFEARVFIMLTFFFGLYAPGGDGLGAAAAAADATK